MSEHIGILTSGGDAPGLNAAIRGVGKAAHEAFGMEVVGFRYGFRGLMQDQIMPLPPEALSNILTLGGTILGTSRDKPHKMPVGKRILDMTDVIVDHYHKHNLDVLVCLGGRGTQKNALRLAEKGLNIITLPKTIDNDIPETEVTFGFDTALNTVTDAIDRLHSTATSHNRIIVVEIMGHRTGWLTLASGLAGGADVILIPEIPYDIDVIADAIKRRTRRGKHFSIVAVAEGAVSATEAKKFAKLHHKQDAAKGKKQKEQLAQQLVELDQQHAGSTLRLTSDLEKRTGLESRLTILGHTQRGGTPSAADRLLATRLGTACAELIREKQFGIMVAARGDQAVAVPLAAAAAQRKSVPPDHHWVRAARRLGVCLGD